MYKYDLYDTQTHGSPFLALKWAEYLLPSTCGGVARAGGHRGRLEDDSVTAGGEPNCHLLVKDPSWSLEEEEKRGKGFFEL